MDLQQETMLPSPKISCLTVTYDRLPFLKRAIQCYCDQQYPNRELIIVSDGEPHFQQAVREHIEGLRRNDITFVSLEGERYVLGALRNIIPVLCHRGYYMPMGR